jgi:hypothetical protein
MVNRGWSSGELFSADTDSDDGSILSSFLLPEHSLCKKLWDTQWIAAPSHSNELGCVYLSTAWFMYQF